MRSEWMEAPHVRKRLHQIEKEGVERQFGTTIIAAKAVVETSMTWNGDGNGACRSLAEAAAARNDERDDQAADARGGPCPTDPVRRSPPECRHSAGGPNPLSSPCQVRSCKARAPRRVDGPDRRVCRRTFARAC